MASREKRILASSKLKQKANNDNGLSLPANQSDCSTSTTSRKSTKSLHPSAKSQQVAREILEAVATGNQLPVKLEASLPRKRALQTALKRKQKAKKTLCVKVKQKVPIKTLKRINEAKSILSKTNTRKNKRKITKGQKDNFGVVGFGGSSSSTPSTDSGFNTSNDSDESKKSKTAKRKGLIKIKEEIVENQNLDIKPPVKLLTSPKLKSVKGPQRISKEGDIVQRIKLRSVSKEPEEPLIQNIKTEPLNDTYEDTIEEVIQSSMIVVNPQVVKDEGNEQKGRRLLVRNPVSAKRGGLRNVRLRRSGIKTEIEDKSQEEEMSGTEVEGSLDVKPALNDDIIFKSENPESTPNQANNSLSDVEKNNNGIGTPPVGELGPKLRSKVKTRNSDSGSSDIEIKQEDKTTTKSEVDLKKEKALAKFDEMKAVTSIASNNSSKCRRSSLNLEMARRSSLTDKSGGTGNPIDDMINKIKMSIAQEIENQISKEKAAKVSALRKSFEAGRRASIDSALSDDIRIENGELKVNAIVHREHDSEIDVDKKQNSVPKVADTAKEIEKLVMGDCKSADTQPPIENDKKELAKAEAIENFVSEDFIEVVQDEKTKKDDNDKEVVSKQIGDVKKPVTRKSARVSAGKSLITTENKKSNFTDERDEVNKSGNEKKILPKSKDNSLESKSENNIPSKKVIEEVKEDETNPSSVKTDSKDPEILKIKDEPVDKKLDVSQEISKAEETLESISRELEMLVEAENDKTATEMTENDNSDVEMQLMIDEETSETTLEKVEDVQSINGCDPKNSEKSIDAEMEIANKSSDDLTDDNAAKIIADTDDSKDKSKDIVEQSKIDTTESSNDVSEKKEIKRVLRTRGDKQKKVDCIKPTPGSIGQNKSDEKTADTDEMTAASEDTTIKNSEEMDNTSSSQTGETLDESTKLSESNIIVKVETDEEPLIRTRRTREAKRSLTLIQTPKSKRGKKSELKKSESPQNKEETLLDNEVAEINENNRSTTFQKSENKLRGVSENAQKLNVPDIKNRSKSENDMRSNSRETEKLEGSVKSNSNETLEGTKAESKEIETKDTDEASTSSESCSTAWKIQETPEDRAKKENILRLLGLESWEKVNERKKKEQEQQYTGSLKTIIKLQKEKDRKKRSRSPLKMVIKHQPGRQVEGEENLDFYIQKEDAPSCSGESSSGANRKLSTNPQLTSDEDDENAPSKDRQSLVIPEKSSSFSIHPGRLCADNCCYCHGKFGSLDTPMHLAQMKSEERKQRILNVMKHLTKDSCLCDACYRHVDRKVHCSPTTQLKPQRQNRQSMYPCSVVNCTEPARHHVKRRWLCKIKANVKDLDINWEAGQHNLLTFCNTHYALIEQVLTCTLCHKRLSKNFTFPVGLSPEATEQLNQKLRGYGIPASMDCNKFVCKLCRFFTKLHVKNADVENMTEANQDFHRKYRKKLLYCNELDVPDSEEEAETNQSSKVKDYKNRPNNNTTSPSTSGIKKSKTNSIEKFSKLSDNFDNHSTASEKSRPGTPKIDCGANNKDGPLTTTSLDSRGSSIEVTVERLKKRKAIDTIPTITSPVSILRNSKDSTKNVVDILSLDKEVTLTKLAKKPKLDNNISVCNNDITPVVQRLGANPSISVRTLFPGEEEMNLHANVEFNNVREVTPQGWEKCATMIQYDRDTKILWQELQRPYGNQSSFLRHLILLEKYYRAGDLILAPNASRNAINYSTSVQNRLISYEGPEKPIIEEPIVQISTLPESNSRRGYSLDSNRSGNTSTLTSSSLANITAQLSKLEGESRVMKLTPGVSIVKKNPPPNLHRLNSNNIGGVNGSAKRKETVPVQKFTGGNVSGASGKVFQLTEPDFKRLQTLKRQKVMNERQTTSSHNSPSGSSNVIQSSSLLKPQNLVQYQKSQLEKAQQSQFQKHLLMQQEMLNQRSRGDFEPLICDTRSMANENAPNTQNLISTLNLPKSIQITAKGPASMMPIPILPKIPKSLTVIPQTVAREK